VPTAPRPVPLPSARPAAAEQWGSGSQRCEGRYASGLSPAAPQQLARHPRACTQGWEVFRCCQGDPNLLKREEKRRRGQDLPRRSRKPPCKVHRVSPPAASCNAGGTTVHITREISKPGQAHQPIVFGGRGGKRWFPSRSAPSRPTPPGGTFEAGAGGEDVPSGRLAQQPGPTVGEGRCSAGASLLAGEASPLQSWGPRPLTAEIPCEQRDRRQQRSQPPLSRHRRGNTQGEEAKVQDTVIWSPPPSQEPHTTTLATSPPGPRGLGAPGSTLPCPGSPWAAYLRSGGLSLVSSAGSLSLYQLKHSSASAVPVTHQPSARGYKRYLRLPTQARMFVSSRCAGSPISCEERQPSPARPAPSRLTSGRGERRRPRRAPRVLLEWEHGAASPGEAGGSGAGPPTAGSNLWRLTPRRWSPGNPRECEGAPVSLCPERRVGGVSRADRHATAPSPESQPLRQRTAGPGGTQVCKATVTPRTLELQHAQQKHFALRTRHGWLLHVAGPELHRAREEGAAPPGTARAAAAAWPADIGRLRFSSGTFHSQDLKEWKELSERKQPGQLAHKKSSFLSRGEAAECTLPPRQLQPSFPCSVQAVSCYSTGRTRRQAGGWVGGVGNGAGPALAEPQKTLG